MTKKTRALLDEFRQRNRDDAFPVDDIVHAFDTMCRCFRKGGMILACGNGGSAADCEHIVGELMKGFLHKRPLPGKERQRFAQVSARAGGIGEKLQTAIPAVSLVSQVSLQTAFANDVDPALVYAQQVYGYRNPSNVLIAISTSGNAQNVINAAVVARVVKLNIIGMTGRSGGRLAPLCDTCIRVPSNTTHLVQEMHQQAYHLLCAMVEEELFGQAAD